MSARALEALRHRAAEERAGLRRIWDEARSNGFSPHELARLARHLEAIDPAHYQDRAGRWVQAEDRFRLNKLERRELGVALLRFGVPERQARSLIGEVSRTTWWRIRQEAANGEPETPRSPPTNRMDKRRDVSLLGSPPPDDVPRPPPAYMDATSGADLEAEIEFRRLIGEPIE